VTPSATPGTPDRPVERTSPSRPRERACRVVAASAPRHAAFPVARDPAPFEQDLALDSREVVPATRGQRLYDRSG